MSKEALRLVSSLMSQDENSICADCKKKSSQWASTNLGVFICLDCSGIHRSLGTHISFVRSCTLDQWTMQQAKFMASVGNKVANEYYEATLPKDYARPDSSNNYQMTNFIRMKYSAKKWTAPGPPPGITEEDEEEQEVEQEQKKQKRTKKRLHSNRSSVRSTDSMDLIRSNPPPPRVVHISQSNGSLTQHQYPVPRRSITETQSPPQNTHNSSDELTLDDLFGSNAPSMSKINHTKQQKINECSSAARKPGQKIPGRLAARMKANQPPPSQRRQLTNSPHSEPSLKSFTHDSESDDPFA